MPPKKSGFISTLNNMGYMLSRPDPYSLSLINFAGESRLPMLEIGAAYGVATITALKKGCQVIANDLDRRHLKILWNRTPKRLRSSLTLLPGHLPNDLSLPPNSVGSVLACRVLHFLDGPNLQRAVRRIFRWLKPGGSFVVVAETPYLKNWGPFLPIYQKRCARGHLWPGFIKEAPRYCTNRRVRDIPKQLHFMDLKVLRRVLTEAGFKIKEMSYIPRKDFPKDVQLDGRESVGAFAVKPALSAH